MIVRICDTEVESGFFSDGRYELSGNELVIEFSKTDVVIAGTFLNGELHATMWSPSREEQGVDRLVFRRMTSPQHINALWMRLGAFD